MSSDLADRARAQVGEWWIAKTEVGKKVIAVYSHEGYQLVKDADYDNEAKAQEIVKKLK